MEFLTAYHTDIGIRKKTNQDALLIKTAQTSKGKAGLFVICDGMGGLSQGELASSTVIRGLSQWFEKELPKIILSSNFKNSIKARLDEHIRLLNNKIVSYGEGANLRLGTTLTALLVVADKYYIFHVGDSRAYKIDNKLVKITDDHSLVAREVSLGHITEEEARVHPRRNVLLQCVGATRAISTSFYTGEIQQNSVFMLCCDGFYHELSNEELYKYLHPSNFKNEEEMRVRGKELVELVKHRKETDNITVLLVKIV